MDRSRHYSLKSKDSVAFETPKLTVCFSLKPNTKYRFRLASQNDMGISDFSRSTNYIRTKENGKIEQFDSCIRSFVCLVPLITPEIVRLSTSQPCQIDIDLKVRSHVFYSPCTFSSSM